MISDEDWQLFSQYNTSSVDKLSSKPKNQKNLLQNVNWNDISKHFLLTEGFMYRYQEYLDWKLIFRYQILSHEFLRNNLSKVYKYEDIVSRYQHLTENMIREFDYFLDWNIPSKYKKLSESFIKEFRHKLDWESIKNYQELSKDFIEKNLSTQLD